MTDPTPTADRVDPAPGTPVLLDGDTRTIVIAWAATPGFVTVAGLDHPVAVGRLEPLDRSDSPVVVDAWEPPTAITPLHRDAAAEALAITVAEPSYGDLLRNAADPSCEACTGRGVLIADGLAGHAGDLCGCIDPAARYAPTGALGPAALAHGAVEVLAAAGRPDLANIWRRRVALPALEPGQLALTAVDGARIAGAALIAAVDQLLEAMIGRAVAAGDPLDVAVRRLNQARILAAGLGATIPAGL